MIAPRIWLWWTEHTLRQPGAWAFAGFLLLVAPLGGRLSPFGELGVDPAAALAGSWVFPSALLGASFALLFLSRARSVLRLVAPKTRRIGEWSVLLTAVSAPQLLLLVGLILTGPPASAIAEDPVFAAGALVLLNLHLAATAILILRIPARPSLRLLLLLSFFWILPAFLGASVLSPFLDPARAWNLRLASSPQLLSSAAATLSLTLIALLVGAPKSTTHP